jgi:hypothetical protein
MIFSKLITLVIFTFSFLIHKVKTCNLTLKNSKIESGNTNFKVFFGVFLREIVNLTKENCCTKKLEFKLK